VIRRVDVKNNNPVIILSRTAPEFLAKLLEIEVPEIFDGLIVIKKIVRDPGERAKVAVESYDDRIDPVGACVGMKGSRIHGIVRELKNENIDVINFTTNIQLLIQRSLTPARITSMELDTENKHANVYLAPDQVSLAIGRRGVNIKLATELTGYELDVYRDNLGEEEEEFDIDLEEFTDEIDEWVIDELKRVGCDTARSVLKLSADELERRTDLEKETIDEVRRVLQTEFENE
jgi:N utilization substance protein A